MTFLALIAQKDRFPKVLEGHTFSNDFDNLFTLDNPGKELSFLRLPAGQSGQSFVNFGPLGVERNGRSCDLIAKKNLLRGVFEIRLRN